MTGSLSLNARRNGLWYSLSTSQAARLSWLAGSLVLVGTNDGNILAPALYSSVGNGASYAWISSSVRSLTQALLMSFPIGNSGAVCENFCPGFFHRTSLSLLNMSNIDLKKSRKSSSYACYLYHEDKYDEIINAEKLENHLYFSAFRQISVLVILK